MDSQVRRVCAAGLLVVCLCLFGCGHSQPVGTEHEPVQLQPIAGTDLSRVIITEEASRNLGIETGPVGEDVSAVPAARKKKTTATTRLSVPMTAVIYDPRGSSWVYTSPAKLTFVRTPVVISGTTSQTAYLSSGPPVGTAVVTVGASELLGAEYGVGGE